MKITKEEFLKEIHKIRMQTEKMTFSKSVLKNCYYFTLPMYVFLVLFLTKNENSILWTYALPVFFSTIMPLAITHFFGGPKNYTKRALKKLEKRIGENQFKEIFYKIIRSEVAAEGNANVSFLLHYKYKALPESEL